MDAPRRARWDPDERGRGVADAAAFASAMDEFAALARTPFWVAEEPEVHLLPHIERALGIRPGLRLVDARVVDAVLLVEIVAESTLAGTPSAESPLDGLPPARRLRVLGHELIASVAETATFVRERREGKALVFEVVTGDPGSERFAAHGHTLRLRLVRGGDS